jgi:hypothetical protein
MEPAGMIILRVEQGFEHCHGVDFAPNPRLTMLGVKVVLGKTFGHQKTTPTLHEGRDVGTAGLKNAATTILS